MSDDQSGWGSGWGQQPDPEQPGPDQPAPDQPAGGGWGQQPPPQPPVDGGWGQQPPPPQPPSDGGWGQQPPPPQQPGWGQQPPAPGYGQPPQPGGYGQPPAPGYGQPPQGPGGYGQPQEGWGAQPQQPAWGAQPGVGGYGVPAGGYGAPQPFSVGDAFGWGWRKFRDNVGPGIVGTLVFIALSIVVGATLAPDVGEGGFPTVGIGTVIGQFIFSFVQYFLYAGIARAALLTSYGQKPEVSTVFSTDNLGPLMTVNAIVAGVAAVLGFLGPLTILSLPLYVIAQYGAHFVIDKQMSGVDALKASMDLVRSNLGQVLLFDLVAVLAVFAGVLACGVGVLAAFPLVVYAHTYGYRSLQGEPIAP